MFKVLKDFLPSRRVFFFLRLKFFLDRPLTLNRFKQPASLEKANRSIPNFKKSRSNQLISIGIILKKCRQSAVTLPSF